MGSFKTYSTSIKPTYEKCGIVGFFTPHLSHKLSLSLLAAAGLQHRGQHGAGVAMCTKRGLVKHTGNGLLNEVFTKKVVEKLDKPCLWTLVQLRYGTFGGYDPYNLQPCITHLKKDNCSIAVTHNGEFAAPHKIRRKLKNKKIPRLANDTYLFTRLLAETEGNTWDEKVLSALDQVRGAFSLIIGIEDTLYVIRDIFGIRPLLIGKKGGGYIIASETHAFDKIGVKVWREIRRGEVLRINKNGAINIRDGLKNPGNYCDFEWAYFSRPDSLSPTREKAGDGQHPERWISYETFRERCGEILAREIPIKKARFVVGAPDSGFAVAMGYAKAAHLPYRQVIVRDHFDPNGLQRLFMRDDQMSQIGKKVLGKLSLVPDLNIWKDAVVVVGDDSIVRGNVSKKLTQAMFTLGAREVHWIIGFPPVAHPCHLGVSMRTGKELIAYRLNSDPKKIAKEVGATSVNYISPEGFIKARKLTSDVAMPKNPKEIFLANGGCAGCITGLYPVSKEGKAHPRFTS